MLTSNNKDALINDNWAFENYSDWPTKYPQCGKNAKVVAPINIDMSKVSPCHELCQLAVNYNPSGCSSLIHNNMPIVYFDPTCIIKFRDEFFYLRKMSIHYPSMHTINGEQYDFEVLLYHNRNKITEDDGGVIISLLFQKGIDYGPVNEFFNEFINQVPTIESATDNAEVEIPVSESWNPVSIFPESKSFFWYEGALPYPPCTANWNIIVFEQIQDISQNIIDTLRFIIGTDHINNRPIQKIPPTVTVFYNTDTTLNTSPANFTASNNSTNVDIQALQSKRDLGFLQRNYLYIKGFLITIIIVMMIVVALKIAKYVVEHDLINRFVIEQVIKRNKRLVSEQREEQMAQSMSDPMLGIQSSQTGEYEPVDEPGEANANLANQYSAAPPPT